MRITAIRAYQIDLPLHEGSYKWSGGNAVTVFDSTVVAIDTDQGITGWGEVCPLGPAYLPAYARDCGWDGAKCWLPFVDCASHDGDSETIVVEVRRGAAGRWVTEAVFLSAHCFGRLGEDCRWYAAADLAVFDWADGMRRGAPLVWVAEGRHANYPGRAACDRGHMHVDTCDRNRLGYRFPIVSMAQNIGSRTRPVGGAGGCVGAAAAGWRSTRVDPDAVECFWYPAAPFHGWQRTPAGAGATAYARYLDEVAEF